MNDSRENVRERGLDAKSTSVHAIETVKAHSPGLQLCSAPLQGSLASICSRSIVYCMHLGSSAMKAVMGIAGHSAFSTPLVVRGYV